MGGRIEGEGVRWCDGQSAVRTIPIWYLNRLPYYPKVPSLNPHFRALMADADWLSQSAYMPQLQGLSARYHLDLAVSLKVPSAKTGTKGAISDGSLATVHPRGPALPWSLILIRARSYVVTTSS